MEMQDTVNTAVRNGASEKTYVTISIGGELYGIDVMRVETVSGMVEMRPVPNALPYMKGVITLRDLIIPVVDMRIKLKLDEASYSKNTVIVIVPVRGKTIGFLVDAVLDVTTLNREEIQDPPHFAADISSDCIDGIAKLGEKTVIIMNVDRIIPEDELESFDIQEIQ
ncbi:MAG: purine-binding chemotaxis protein CheW [Spirochaetes bacterium]|nr:purine-binding chemotaxis protein CheW [Spirochaetota bacterium]